MNCSGCLIGVSLGPGDPGLITRRAYEVLERRDAHWAYPVRKTKGSSFALEIVNRAGLNPPGPASPLVFPMTSEPLELAKAWQVAAQTLLPVLGGGRDVAFLVEGDASTYAAFGYLSKAVKALDATVVTQTIPGVSAYHAAAARLGTPLGDNDDAVAILPAAYGVAVLDRLLNDFDTLVLLKVKPLLDELIAWLRRRGLLRHARFVEKVGTPEERIVEDISVLEGEVVHYLSLLLVKNPARPRGRLIRGCRPKSFYHA